MAQEPKLQQRQVQRLTMTQEMQLSLQILQYDAVDLAAYLDRETEANPLMEFSGDGPPAPPKKDQTDPGQSAEGTIESPESVDKALYNTVFTNDSSEDNAFKPQSDNSGFHETAPFPVSNAGGGLSPTFQKEKTLHDHIHDQLSLLVLEPKAGMIANYLADSLNRAGYLATPLEEVAEALGCTLEEVEGVLPALQELEPPGIFSRDLKECLKLQLQDKGLYGGCAKAVLDHLDLVAANDIQALKKLSGASGADLKSLIRAIHELDPKPGLCFEAAGPLQTLIPDIFVRKDKKGAWRVELNNDALPKLLINETYSTALKAKTLSKTETSYLKVCRTKAGWLQRALDQRAQTILKIAGAIVEHQVDFFEKGVRHLRPFTYREIAEMTDFHESTVSRVVQNKYLSSSRGTFKLRYFFSSLLGGEDGTVTSAAAVKHRIRELIAAEHPPKALSDDKIAGRLKQEGITISRRTVMKYREAMRIPSSFERRQMKARFAPFT